MKYLLFFVPLLFSLHVRLTAQEAFNEAAYIRANYVKKEVMVPMRDGKKLFTAIYTPKDSTRKYPVLLTRTPYSCSPYGETEYRNSFQNIYLVQSGYIFVFQDVRGRYMSEGDFVDVRPFNPAKKTPQDVDEASDTYDTADWLLKNLKNCNGNIGVQGISYPGFYATMAILADHPAIKAVSPQAPVTNWFIGDDFHHNGAFCLMDAFSFYSGFGKPRPQPTTKGSPGFSDWKTPDNYDFYLRAGALRNYNEKYLKNGIPFWNDLMQHADYDDWWKARTPQPHLKNIRTAVLTVGGLFDAEDCWGAWNTYKSIEAQNSSKTSNRVVMGPWVHGGWRRTTGDKLGNVTFGGPTSDYYLKNIETPFFEYYLKGNGKLELPEASVFETGSNRWTTYDTWPPASAQPVKYYFQENEMLSADPKPATTGLSPFDDYVSDPANPVPYTEDVHLHRTNEYMSDDQRFASRRPDVLVYQTDVLQKDLTVTGPVIADLWVSITGSDADFVVKLIDVFPDTLRAVSGEVPLGGYQMLVRGEVMRGRYRNGFDQPMAFVPGEVNQVRFELPDVAHTFKAGHKMMVQIQSSWFPLIDRNPQQFVNIYEARDEEFVKSTHNIWHTAAYPSCIVVPVLNR